MSRVKALLGKRGERRPEHEPSEEKTEGDSGAMNAESDGGSYGRKLTRVYDMKTPQTNSVPGLNRNQTIVSSELNRSDTNNTMKDLKQMPSSLT